MDENARAWMELVFRWIHVVAAIFWIGHLYFFNFVNSQLVKTYDADSKKKVVPELMPRALYWFRWGAAYTWVTGVLLLGVLYYMGHIALPPESTLSSGVAVLISLGILIVGFFIYDVLWKALEKKESVGTIISFLFVVGISFGLYQVYTPRAAFIHVGGLFGTIMAANVWMRIWPAQRRIISATKAGTAPDAAQAFRAGLRSKHNTYLSVPLVFAMISNHYPTVYGNDLGWAFLSGSVVVGWLVTKLFYKKAATPAPARYEPAASAAPSRPSQQAT